jgi:hypothetical protein
MAEKISRIIPIQWVQTIKDDGTYEFTPDPNVYSTQKNVPSTSTIDFQSTVASSAISASFALTSSFAQNAQTASYFSGSISNAINAISASYALTASYFSGSISNAISAISASYALTASYAMNSSVIDTPFRISTGSISASVNIGSTIFLITNNNIPILTVSQSGIVILATQSIDPTGIAPNGAIYFTSSSLFIGLD